MATSTTTVLTKTLTLTEVRSFLGNDHVYEAGSGQYLVNVFGKYMPNITFVISSSFELDEHERVMNPFVYISDQEVTDEMNMNFGGDAKFMFGDFWRSKKGGACFRPKDPMQAKHLLVKITWGGAFDSSRGNSRGGSLPGVLYFRRASSNGGGAGNDYYVLPVGYKLIRDTEGNPQEEHVQNSDQIRKKHSYLRHETRAKRLRLYEERIAAEAASRAKREELLPRLEEIQAELEELQKPQASGTRYGVRKLILGETHLEVRYTQYLYGEESLAEAEAYLARSREWVAEEEAKKAAEAKAKADFSPRFEVLRLQVEAFGWEMTLGDKEVQIKDPAKPEIFGYDNPKHFAFSTEGVEALKAHLTTEADLRAEEERKRAQVELEERGLAAGLPSNVRIWHRAGATNTGKGWVIRPDGTDRSCDEVDTSMLGSKTKRNHQRYEGDHIWRQICPGELVLLWRKAYTAAEHEFEVIYAPAKITEAQLERVAEIQDDIEESWKGRTGLASKKASPSIGQGWGLFPRKASSFGIAPDGNAQNPIASSEEEPGKEDGIDPASPMAKAFMAALAGRK